MSKIKGESSIALPTRTYRYWQTCKFAFTSIHIEDIYIRVVRFITRSIYWSIKSINQWIFLLSYIICLMNNTLNFGFSKILFLYINGEVEIATFFYISAYKNFYYSRSFISLYVFRILRRNLCSNRILRKSHSANF